MPTNLPMFNTWKYGPEGKVENLKTSHDYETARSSQHQACNRCHEKKLKCSGEKDGCDRCSTHGLSCEYIRSGSRHSKKGKSKSDRHSSCSSRSGRDGSGSPKSSHTSHSSKHKERKSSSNSHRIREEPYEPNGGVCRGVSGQVDYGTYDYDLLAATAASQSSGYPATSTSMAEYAAAGVGDNYGSQWVLPPGTSAPGMSSAFMPSSGPLYTDDGTAYANYPTQADYEMYQNVDPRYWDRNQGQH